MRHLAKAAVILVSMLLLQAAIGYAVAFVVTGKAPW